MSLRLLSNRLFKNGRYFLRNYWIRQIHTNILDQGKNRGVPASLRKASQILPKQPLGLLRFGQHARKLFVDNILNRVTTTYSAEIRTKATKKFLYGDSAPFFALVGVSLASGTGVLTKDDELEGVCWEIREAVARLQKNHVEIGEPTIYCDENTELSDLDIGPPIAKGCAAVVYAAAKKTADTSDDQTGRDSPPVNLATVRTPTPQFMSPIQEIGRLMSTVSGSVDNLMQSRDFDSELATPGNIRRQQFSRRARFDSITEVQDARSVRFNLSPTVIDLPDTTDDHEDNESTFEFKLPEAGLNIDSSIVRYPLALKMMFNYDIQSNAMAILRAMYKETIPAQRRMHAAAENWEKTIVDQTVQLPIHPNIVFMMNVFCAQVPNLTHAAALYPMALPPRLNPNGYGRNMSLFLLMKRYNYCLHDFLKIRTVEMRTSILLFAQLLEAVVHLYRYGVSHRDLKSDNILIELKDNSTPLLVLSDFGCCLADKTHGLQLPYTSHDMDKGGNTALMAPEIILQQPGTFSILNYTKSDLWACGTIAYEIFNNKNPFYEGQSADEPPLRNVDYKESDLPQLNSEVPPVVNHLILNMLQRNPKRRLSPDVAANVMQLFLWAPSAWLKKNSSPSSPEILQWLLCLTTKVLCESRTPQKSTKFADGRHTYSEYLLISSFLVRASLTRIRRALAWIQTVA